MIIKDKKVKKQLDKVPNKDKNGQPIFKIADTGKNDKPVSGKPGQQPKSS